MTTDNEDQLRKAQAYLKRLAKAEYDDEWAIGVVRGCMTCNAADTVPSSEHLASYSHAAKVLGVYLTDVLTGGYTINYYGRRIRRPKVDLNQILQNRLDDLFSSSTSWGKINLTIEGEEKIPGAPDIEPVHHDIPVEQWRGFKLTWDSGKPYLGGALAQNGYWKTKTMRAICNNASNHWSMTEDEKRTQCVEHVLNWTQSGGVDRRMPGFSGYVYGGTISASPLVQSTSTNNCHCGTYGYARPGMLNLSQDSFNIYARTISYGYVTLDEEGNSRATDAMITEVFLDVGKIVGDTIGYTFAKYFDHMKLCQEIADHYQVPVIPIGNFRELEQVDGMIASGMWNLLQIARPIIKD